MEKEEILKTAQSEKTPNDEYERSATVKELSYAFSVGILLFAVMIILEFVVVGKPDFGKGAIIMAIIGVLNICESKRTGKKKLFFFGVGELVFMILLLILYLGALFG